VELATMIGNADLDPASVTRAQQLLRDGGSLAFSEERSAALLAQAATALEHLEIQAETRLFLSGLMRLLVNRTE
jgi:geranylgeranyl pyrophosphate synthase